MLGAPESKPIKEVSQGKAKIAQESYQIIPLPRFRLEPLRALT